MSVPSIFKKAQSRGPLPDHVTNVPKGPGLSASIATKNKAIVPSPGVEKQVSAS